MRDVIEQMKEDSCECKDSVFVSTIKTYANVGLVNEEISGSFLKFLSGIHWHLYFVTQKR